MSQSGILNRAIIPPGTGIEFLTGNSGGAVGPDGSNNINTVGTGSITIVGNPGTNTLTTQLTGLTQHSLQVGGTSGTLTQLGVASNGQLPIGSGGADPVLATLTPGTGISISNGAGSITISASGSGFTWHDVIGGSATLAAENGYVADAAGLTTFTMPTNNSIGDTIKIVGKGSGGWTIIYGTNQFINFGSITTTTTSGSLSSSNAHDCLELVCTTASATIPIFTVVSSIGNISWS